MLEEKVFFFLMIYSDCLNVSYKHLKFHCLINYIVEENSHVKLCTSETALSLQCVDRRHGERFMHICSYEANKVPTKLE